MADLPPDLPLVSVPVRGFCSFLDVPVCTDLDRLDAEVAFLGVPYAVPYEMGQTWTSGAPAYLREKSSRVRRAMSEGVNFDRERRPINLGKLRMVDCGDVPFAPMDIADGVRRTTEAVRRIVAAGAVPIVFGGDDAVPIPVIRAYQESEPIVVVQIDEHLDWAESRDGVREGYSSPMRRVAEMPWVARTVQIGLHSFTLAAQYADAQAAGNVLITESDVHERGVAWVLDQIPGGQRYFLTFDFDGLDTLACPAVSHPEPGGLNWREACDLLCGLAGRGTIVGMDFVEFTPAHDLNGLGGHTACRLIANLLAAMVESGQLGA